MRRLIIHLKGKWAQRKLGIQIVHNNNNSSRDTKSNEPATERFESEEDILRNIYS